MNKHRIITAAGFVISIVLLYFSLRGIEYRQLAAIAEPISRTPSCRMLHLPLPHPVLLQMV